jgi:hypothetical protein
MKHLLIAVIASVLLTSARPAAAQAVRGWAFTGRTTDINAQNFPAAGGGVLAEVGQPWLLAGLQGEALFHLPYVAGRGAVFAQGRILPKSPYRPFVLGGIGFGEDAGPMIGGGIEVGAPNSRWGLRMSVEDYVRRVDIYSFGLATGGSELRHQVALRFGITF